MTTNRGVYIHIPFCKKKCAYCDFYSVSPDTDIILRYTDALCEEIRAGGDKYADAPVNTLYIGGGTPVLAGERALERIVRALEDSFKLELEEFTVELNPDDDNPYAFLKELGVNRVSIGVQSVTDEVLRAAGRRHDGVAAIRALESANKYFDNVSADLMLGLPFQTVASATDSVNTVLPYVKHVSAYMLKLSRSVSMSAALARGEYTLPDDDLTVDMYEAVFALLGERGFARYEISNFALPGYESKHNLKYWRREEYLGFGAAAHSQTGDFRYANPASLKDYIAGKRLGNGTARREQIGADEAAFEYVMLGLRTAEGVDVAACEARFGFDFDERFAGALHRLRDVLVREGNRLRIRDDMLLLESAVALEFMD